nr:MAG TPA: hypothetical protein [Caudoviricetes sp.]
MLYSVFCFATLKLQLCNRFHFVFISQQIFTKRRQTDGNKEYTLDMRV